MRAACPLAPKPQGGEPASAADYEYVWPAVNCTRVQLNSVCAPPPCLRPRMTIRSSDELINSTSRKSAVCCAPNARSFPVYRPELVQCYEKWKRLHFLFHLWPGSEQFRRAAKTKNCFLRGRVGMEARSGKTINEASLTAPGTGKPSSPSSIQKRYKFDSHETPSEDCALESPQPRTLCGAQF